MGDFWTMTCRRRPTTTESVLTLAISTLLPDEIQACTGKGRAGFEKAARPTERAQISLNDAARLEAGLITFYRRPLFRARFDELVSEMLHELGHENMSVDVNHHETIVTLTQELGDIATVYAEATDPRSANGEDWSRDERDAFAKELIDLRTAINSALLGLGREG